MSPNTFTCWRHDVTFPVLSRVEYEARNLPIGCVRCTDEITRASDPKGMSGDDRAAEVIRLLNDPLTVAWELVHDRITQLVGRDVWTHEMVNPRVLAEEARDWKHPADLRAHVLGTLRDAVGDKPIIVVEGRS